MSQLAVFPPAQGVRCHVPSKCHHCLLLATPGGSNVSVLIFQGRTEALRTKAAHPGLCRSWSSDLCTSPCGCSLAVTCRSHNQQLQALGSPWPLAHWLAEVLSPRGPGQISLGDGSWSERCVPPGPGRQRQCMWKGRPVRRHWRLSLLVSRKAGLLSLSKQGAQIQLLLDRDSRRAWSSELLCRWPGAQRQATRLPAINLPEKNHQGQRSGAERGFRQSQRGKETCYPERKTCPSQPYYIPGSAAFLEA